MVLRVDTQEPAGQSSGVVARARHPTSTACARPLSMAMGHVSGDDAPMAGEAGRCVLCSSAIGTSS